MEDLKPMLFTCLKKYSKEQFIKDLIAGIIVAIILAGIILILMGFCRFGSLIKFIPYTITTGFTAGIAVTIAIGQLKDFCGSSMFSNSYFYAKGKGACEDSAVISSCCSWYFNGEADADSSKYNWRFVYNKQQPSIIPFAKA